MTKFNLFFAISFLSGTVLQAESIREQVGALTIDWSRGVARFSGSSPSSNQATVEALQQEANKSAFAEVQPSFVTLDKKYSRVSIDSSGFLKAAFHYQTKIYNDGTIEEAFESRLGKLFLSKDQSEFDASPLELTREPEVEQQAQANKSQQSQSSFENQDQQDAGTSAETVAQQGAKSKTPEKYSGLILKLKASSAQVTPKPVFSVYNKEGKEMLRMNAEASSSSSTSKGGRGAPQIMKWVKAPDPQELSDLVGKHPVVMEATISDDKIIGLNDESWKEVAASLGEISMQGKVVAVVPKG